MYKQISSKEKLKIETMNKKQLGGFIMKTNKNSAGFSYAIQQFKQRK